MPERTRVHPAAIWQQRRREARRVRAEVEKMQAALHECIRSAAECRRWLSTPQQTNGTKPERGTR